jgi:hypothetical protein
MPKSGTFDAGGAELAQRVARSIMLAKLQYSALIPLAIGIAAAVVALAQAGVRFKITRSAVATIAPQPAQAKSASNRLDAPLVRAQVAGVVALQGGDPAKGAIVLFSTVEHAYEQGDVRAETPTGDGGKFQLDISPVDIPWAGFVGTGTLWAYKPGSLVAFVPVYRGALPPGLPQRLVLGPPTRAPVEVLGPDGKAVHGAKVEPRALAQDRASVPDRLASLIGAETVTDFRGRAVMTAFFPDEITAIRVTAAGYGHQEFTFGPERFNDETKVVRLRAVGGLKGRVVGKQDAARHCRLHVTSFSPPDDPLPRTYTRTISTDENGRFELSEIAVGSHSIATVPRFDFGWWARPRGLLEVLPGKTTHVELILKPAVRVRGIVREKGTQKPIAGVQVAVAIAETGAMTTGQDGTYEGYVPPGATFMTARYIPAAYARPFYSFPQVNIPEDAVEFVLPPFELSKAGEVAGLVVDENSRPTAGAEVEASWMMEERRRRTLPQDLVVRSGPDGRFVFQGIHVDAEVSLSARYHGLRAREPRPAPIGSATTLRLRSADSVAMEGRILDGSGRALPGASVHLRYRRRATQIGQADEEGLVLFERGFVLVTDVQGRYRTPEELELDREYTAYAHAEGYHFNRTGWTTCLTGSFPALKLQAIAASD